MKSNKVLMIHSLAFNLPDDFKGDMFDAMREILKYHDTPEAKKNHNEGSRIPVEEMGNAFDELWENDNSRLQLYGEIGNYKDGQWELGDIE